MKKKMTTKQEQFIENADLGSLGAFLSDLLEHAREQKNKNQDNRKLAGRLGKKSVTFAVNLSGFLQAYSGIVEIMKGADQQCGGVAYGTLSIFLIVRMFPRIRRTFNANHLDCCQ